MSIKKNRRYVFQVQHDEQCLQGEIVYNSKDYHIALIEPFYARNTGSGLMYMIPARYTTPIDTDREQRTDGVIRLEERAEQELIEIYETYKNTPFEDFVERFLLPHEESLCILLRDSFLSIEIHEERKRAIKKQYMTGLITNKKQSQQIQEENRYIKEKKVIVHNLFTKYCEENSIQIPRVHRSEINRHIKNWYIICVANNSS